MIKKFVGVTLIFDLLLAVAISMVFIAKNQPIQPVQLGSSFLSFVQTCSAELNEHKIAIPNIPEISPITNSNVSQDSNWWSQVLDFFVNFSNAFFSFINAFIKVINVGIQFINVIIQLFELIVIMLKNLITFKDNTNVMVENSNSWYEV